MWITSNTPKSFICFIKKEIQAAYELDYNMKTRKCVSCVWGRCHFKHCCALMPYKDVSVWLHRLFLIKEAETSSTNRSDAPWEQGVPRFLWVTGSLPENHRGKPRVCPSSFITSTLTRYGCSALWSIHKSGHAWMRAYTNTHIYTHIHTYTQFQELFLFFGSYLTLHCIISFSSHLEFDQQP